MPDSSHFGAISVAELWRYPVKSVGGERLAGADVTFAGVRGDRAWAVWDEVREEITWAGQIHPLMSVTARLGGDPGADAHAEMVAPDGSAWRSDHSGAAAWLSGVVGHPVRLMRFPGDENAGTLHLLTTASLRTMAAALPSSRIDVTRFRPNILLEAGASGHPEHRWLGRRLQVGAVTLRITGFCRRCVMINQATPAVPADPAVLRWVARELGNLFGVYADVEVPGVIHPGDPVALC